MWTLLFISLFSISTYPLLAENNASPQEISEEESEALDDKNEQNPSQGPRELIIRIPRPPTQYYFIRTPEDIEASQRTSNIPYGEINSTGSYYDPPKGPFGH